MPPLDAVVRGDEAVAVTTQHGALAVLQAQPSTLVAVGRVVYVRTRAECARSSAQREALRPLASRHHRMSARVGGKKPGEGLATIVKTVLFAATDNSYCTNTPE